MKVSLLNPEGLARRWIPLLFIIPIVWLLRPVFWDPLDDRFYNYFLSKRETPAWNEVVVVGIDKATVKDVLEKPAYPLSNHEKQHAQVTRNLNKSGAREIVFDLQMTEDLFGSAPLELAAEFRRAGNVVLAMSVVKGMTVEGETDFVYRMPHDSLLAASKGGYVVNCRVDSDGCLRRYTFDPFLSRMGLKRLPEYLSGKSVKKSVPLDFPSMESSVPVVSYRDVFNDNHDALSVIDGKIVLIGALADETDMVRVPRMQRMPDGEDVFVVPGVMALAVITENLIRGESLRDASLIETVLWVMIWCLLITGLMHSRKPARSAGLFITIFVLALTVTGLIHVHFGLIFPAGFLLGSILVSGGYTFVWQWVISTRELFAEEAEIAMVKRELDSARSIQLGFLPGEIPKVPGLDIWGTNISCMEVSGDYFDIIQGEDPDSLVIAIADVSGKGLPAALLMSNLQAGLHMGLRSQWGNLADVTAKLNNLIYENTEDNKFITFFAAEVSIPSKKIKCVRAGHDTPVIVDARGEIKMLSEGGIILGCLPDMFYEANEVQMEKGDFLCLYTDGVTEALNVGGEEYGIDRLKEILSASVGQTAEEIVKGIVGSVKKYSGPVPQSDDITLVVLRVS